MKSPNLLTRTIAKAGFVTRKGAMYYAEKAGRNFADKSKELNKVLETKDIVQVINESLPKRLRPKILSNRLEMVDCYMRSGCSKESAEVMAKDIRFVGFCVPNGTKKRPLYFDKSYDVAECSSVFAHELEHALEFNNRLSGLLSIKFGKVYSQIRSLLNKNYHKTNGNISFRSLSLQSELISELYMRSGNVDIPNIVLQHCDFKSLNSSPKKILSNYKKQINQEIPAYTVGGNVFKYANNVNNSEQSKIAELYKKVVDFISKAKKSSDRQLKNDIVKMQSELFGNPVSVVSSIECKNNAPNTDFEFLNNITDSKYEQILLDLI